ncbi:MAG: serine protease [Planctomycetes bacterium]|nr:serine protease [Planctomycetota bacterium]
MRTSAPLILAAVLFVALLASQADGRPRHGAFAPVPKSMLRASLRLRAGGRVTGAAVAIGKHRALTALHATGTGEALAVEVSSPDGGYAWREATVVARDETHDLALLETKEAFGVWAPLAKRDTLRPGDALIAVGAPMGTALCASAGYLARAGAEGHWPNDAEAWQASNAGYFGNSGGPVFDANSGEIVGIAVGGVGHFAGGMAPNALFFEPAPRLRAFLEAAGKE